MIHVPLISVYRKKGQSIRLDSTYINYNTQSTGMPICYTNFFFIYNPIDFLSQKYDVYLLYSIFRYYI